MADVSEPDANPSISGKHFPLLGKKSKVTYLAILERDHRNDRKFIRFSLRLYAYLTDVARENGWIQSTVTVKALEDGGKVIDLFNCSISISQ